MLPILIKLKNLWVDNTYFNTNIKNIIKTYYPTDTEWLDDDKMYTNWNTIYNLIINRYGERIIRYQEQEFNKYIINIILENLPALYIRQQIFVENQLEFLKDKDNWGTQNNITYSGNNNATATGLNTNATTNKGDNNNTLDYIPNTPGNPGDKIYQKVFDKINQTTTGNNNYTLNGGSFDYLNNLEKIANSLVVLGIDQFLNKFNNLFTRINISNLL